MRRWMVVTVILLTPFMLAPNPCIVDCNPIPPPPPPFMRVPAPCIVDCDPLPPPPPPGFVCNMPAEAQTGALGELWTGGGCGADSLFSVSAQASGADAAMAKGRE
jgi:hypothetical protein